jgi:hypothetical protein
MPMTTMRTILQYRSELEALLDDRAAPLTDAETTALRAIVRERRSGRRGQPGTPAPSHILQRADGIVDLLNAAARELRPRETQQLDDLVAGRAPSLDPAPTIPIRRRRGGWPSR